MRVVNDLRRYKFRVIRNDTGRVVIIDPKGIRPQDSICAAQAAPNARARCSSTASPNLPKNSFKTRLFICRIERRETPTTILIRFLIPRRITEGLLAMRQRPDPTRIRDLVSDLIKSWTRSLLASASNDPISLATLTFDGV